MNLMNKGKTGIIVMVFVALCITAWATKCHGAGIAVSGGAAVIRGPTAALQVEWQWKSPQSRDAHWETGVTMIGNSTFSGVEQNNTFALNATYVDGFGPVDIGIGPAYLQNTDTYNHEGMNFNLMLGYHHGRYFVHYNHFSNAGSKTPNLGRDLVMVGVVL